MGRPSGREPPKVVYLTAPTNRSQNHALTAISEHDEEENGAEEEDGDDADEEEEKEKEKELIYQWL